MFFPPKTPDVHPLGPGLWEIGDAGINLYLIAGSERAIMLDTGFGSFVGLRALAEGLCGLPTLLVHTHAHGDHTGSDHEWDEAWLHPSEWARFRSDRGEGVRLLPLEDGQRFDLGGRTLEVIHVPGHSAGSVALLDRENRLLFSGDTVMTQPVFLFNPDSSPADCLSSLEYLASISDAFDRIYPCHMRFPLDPREAFPAMIACARLAVENDPAKLSVVDVPMGPEGETVPFRCYACNGYGAAMEPPPGMPGPAGPEEHPDAL